MSAVTKVTEVTSLQDGGTCCICDRPITTQEKPVEVSVLLSIREIVNRYFGLEEGYNAERSLEMVGILVTHALATASSVTPKERELREALSHLANRVIAAGKAALRDYCEGVQHLPAAEL